LACTRTSDGVPVAERLQHRQHRVVVDDAVLEVDAGEVEADRADQLGRRRSGEVQPGAYGVLVEPEITHAADSARARR